MGSFHYRIGWVCSLRTWETKSRHYGICWSRSNRPLSPYWGKSGLCRKQPLPNRSYALVHWLVWQLLRPWGVRLRPARILWKNATNRDPSKRQWLERKLHLCMRGRWRAPIYTRYGLRVPRSYAKSRTTSPWLTTWYPRMLHSNGILLGRSQWKGIFSHSWLSYPSHLWQRTRVCCWTYFHCARRKTRCLTRGREKRRRVGGKERVIK